MSTKTVYKEKSLGLITLLKFLKSLFVSLITTFSCIILFAFIIKWAGLDDDVIAPVNLIIKALSVLFGVLILNKKSSKKLINGLVFAILYTFVSFVIFTCLTGKMILGLGLVADFGYNVTIGIIASFLSAIGKWLEMSQGIKIFK